MIRLRFDKGTILLRGEVGTPYGKWDPRVGCYRAKALHYQDVLAYLRESEVRARGLDAKSSFRWKNWKVLLKLP